jgi:hypothetical protein
MNRSASIFDDDIRFSSVPVTAADPRPVMTEKELSFHKSQAGLRAAAQATENPSDPAAVDALMEAAAGPIRIGSVEMLPVTLGTLKALQAAQPLFTGQGEGVDQLDDVCLAILIFSNPIRCWSALRDGRGAELKAEADALAFRLSLSDLRRADAWINGQLTALAAASGGEVAAPEPESGLGKPLPA